MAGQSQAVIDAILAKIDLGTLSPGDAIDGDALAAELDVSATPMREALIQLEAHGLIERLPRKGAVVFKPSLREFLSIMEVQAKLEGQAAGLAARRLSAERARELQAMLKACEDHYEKNAETKPDAYYQCNLDFHRVIAESAGNEFLLSMIKSNARKVMAYYRARYHFVGVTKASVADHQAITKAILGRDDAGAEALMHTHMQFDQVTALDLLTIFE